MIDMSSIFTHKDYAPTLSRFKSSDCNWSIFQDLHKSLSNDKCPICEVQLNNKPSSPHLATIDHFRPKAMYTFLKCDPKNYILMCKLCNSTYKDDSFPLLDESKKATKIEDINKENPLLLNPTKQNPLDFFELAFRQTSQGGILELKRKQNIDKGSYEYKICEITIKLFGLGYCHKYIHPNDDTKECRIGILAKHYTTFIEMAEAIRDKNKKALTLILRDRKQELEKYGFFQFIMKKQFVIK